MQEILKQPQYSPVELENQVIIIFAGTNGYASGVPVEKMAQWQVDLARFMETSYPEVGKDILETNRITDETKETMTKALDAFRAGWQA